MSLVTHRKLPLTHEGRNRVQTAADTAEGRSQNRVSDIVPPAQLSIVDEVKASLTAAPVMLRGPCLIAHRLALFSCPRPKRWTILGPSTYFELPLHTGLSEPNTNAWRGLSSHRNWAIIGLVPQTRITVLCLPQRLPPLYGSRVKSSSKEKSDPGDHGKHPKWGGDLSFGNEPLLEIRRRLLPVYQAHELIGNSELGLLKVKSAGEGCDGMSLK